MHKVHRPGIINDLRNGQMAQAFSRTIRFFGLMRLDSAQAPDKCGKPACGSMDNP